MVVPVCFKTPLLCLLTQKTAQKFGYVLGIGESRIVCLDKVSYLCTMILNFSNSLLPKERGFLFSYYEWLRSFLSRLTSLISSLILSRVISGNSPLSAIALISANAAFAFAVTSSSSYWAFCRLSFRMVSDYFTRITHGI